MNRLLQDVGYAWRSVRTRPGFALLAIFILALGAGATTIMFTATSGVLASALSVKSLIVAIGLTFLVAVAAALLPARRAAKVAPMVALRCE